MPKKLDVWGWTRLMKQMFYDHPKSRCIYVLQGDQYRAIKDVTFDLDNGDLIIVIETAKEEKS